MQDVMLGLLIAILPALAGKTASGDGGSMGTVLVCLKLIGSLVGLVILCFLLSRYIIGPYFRFEMRMIYRCYKNICTRRYGICTTTFYIRVH